MAFPEGFSWDPNKRIQVLEQHGVDFIDVVNVFLNPIIEDYDNQHSGQEDRYRALGYWDGRVYLVVYVYDGPTRRLITAWHANEKQSTLYFNHFFGDPLE